MHVHIVELQEVVFAYDGGGRRVLDGVSMTVPRGKITAIMGASGGGKTTILRLIGGLQRAQQGKVLFDGADVTSMNVKALYAARRRMGMLFQFGALFSDLSVFDNVAFALREMEPPLPQALLRNVVLLKLHAVGLRGAAHLGIHEISGGMARRVALARAMVLDPELIMYDEPFAGLDPISLGTVARMVRRLNDALGLSSVIVSHDVDETFAIADHIAILAQGRVVAAGTPEQVRASPDPLVQQFIHARAQGPVGFHYQAPTLAEDFAL